MTTQQLASKRLEFDDATEAMEHYFEKGWTDGLPVIPPTVKRVGQFLDHSERSPSEIVGTEPTKGRVLTAEKVAVNAVMAGCLPEYFPVVLAVIEAICEPQFNLHGTSVTTGGAGVLTVVNGPVVNQIGMNSGAGAFGPGNRANATIGRAVRLVLMNATGAVPGILDKSTLAHPGKYTWCIAEGEENSPWEPLHVERGLSADQSAVTVFAGVSQIQAGGGGSPGPEAVIAGMSNAFVAVGLDQNEIIVVLTPEIVGHLKPAGWSKKEVKEKLFELSSREVSGAVRSVGKSPDSFTIIVAGGMAGAFAAVIGLWGGGLNSRSVTKEVRTSS